MVFRWEYDYTRSDYRAPPYSHIIVIKQKAASKGLEIVEGTLQAQNNHAIQPFERSGYDIQAVDWVLVAIVISTVATALSQLSAYYLQQEGYTYANGFWQYTGDHQLINPSDPSNPVPVGPGKEVSTESKRNYAGWILGGIFILLLLFAVSQ